MNDQENKMYIVFGLDGDEGDPSVQVTTPGGDPGQKLISVVDPGKRCYVFASIPFSFANGIVVNWAEALTCDADAATNNLAIAIMLESPPLDMISAA